MLGLRLFVVFILSAGISPAFGYVRTMSSSGHPLFWSKPSVVMRANPRNSIGMSSTEVSSLLSSAFSGWNQPGTIVNFSYLQSSSFPTSSANDRINNVYFTSAAGNSLEWGVVALTEVLYYLSNGQIVEADMSFNDDQFLFTGNKGDTGKMINGSIAIYLPDVATHEAGHVIGLDHGLVNLSSLIYTAFNGQFSLSNDEKNAVRTIYPAANSGGGLEGNILGTEGGIFGAHLAALNLATGKIEAGTLSASNGNFRLGDLPEGSYAVMMEPFGAPISSVSAYYQNVNHEFCGSSMFRRRFYASCDSNGLASVVNLSPGSNINLGTLTPSCSRMENQAFAPNSIATARELPSQGGAAWGRMNPGGAHYYLVRNVSGQLSARAISYSIYSPLDLKVKILAADGSALPGASSTDNIESPEPGGNINYDSLATANVNQDSYIIEVSSKGSRLPASKYSAGFDLLDADGHYLLALGVNGSFGPSNITDMSSCLTVHNTAQSAIFSESLPSTEDKTTGAGCGALHTGPGGPFSGGLMLVLLTALGFQLLSLLVRFLPDLVRRQR